MNGRVARSIVQLIVYTAPRNQGVVSQNRPKSKFTDISLKHVLNSSHMFQRDLGERVPTTILWEAAFGDNLVNRRPKKGGGAWIYSAKAYWR